jgi:serine/tyrosine/threonine adenylyltransferase
MFYDGRPQREPGAIVCRVAPTFIRFGNFQIFAARNETDLLERLTDFCIEQFCPQMELDPNSAIETKRSAYEEWFHGICVSTADMVLGWMRVGFVHGVMNTDNMSILGQTIDYGPYGWIDDYDLEWTPNTTDAQGRRYAFGRQPEIAQWNLVQLANALYDLFDEPGPLQRGLDAFVECMTNGYRAMHLAKLGLSDDGTSAMGDLVNELSEWLGAYEIDMTIFYRELGNIGIDHLASWRTGNVTNASLDETIGNSWYRKLAASELDRMRHWLTQYAGLVIAQSQDPTERRNHMHRTNPKYVLRNYIAQQAIDAATLGDMSELEHVLHVLSRPYDEQPEFERYYAKRPDWARNKPGCSMLSCSS